MPRGKNRPVVRPLLGHQPQPLQARPRIMMDSGAFTAFSQGKPVDLGDYIEFCHDQSEYLDEVVTLDAIPSRDPKRRLKGIAAEQAALESWVNTATMRRAGLDPIPVYHSGERLYWLEKYVGEGYTRIALGGVARQFHRRSEWIDSVFNALCGDAPYTTIRVHLLGISKSAEVYRYPSVSADSSSYMRGGGTGFIIHPQLDETERRLDYRKNLVQPHVSRDPLRRVSEGFGDAGSPTMQTRSLWSRSPKEIEHARRAVELLGYDLEAAAEDYTTRAAVICKSYEWVAANKNRRLDGLPGDHAYRRRVGLFGRGRGIAPSDRHPGDFRIYGVIASDSYSAALNNAGVHNRLISYAEFPKGGQARRERLRNLSESGYNDPSYNTST